MLNITVIGQKEKKYPIRLWCVPLKLKQLSLHVAEWYHRSLCDCKVWGSSPAWTYTELGGTLGPLNLGATSRGQHFVRHCVS